MKFRETPKAGEALAIYRDAMFWDQALTVPPNEMCGAAEVVYLRGSLEHHPTEGCDSYDALKARLSLAFANRESKVVVLRIDSPGGVVSGLNETVYAMRKMSKDAGKPLIAYVDELSASAAYAIACGCEEIFVPPSGICGSVGVISTMYDQVSADKKQGVNFVTITSGARKADGHPHVAISPEAVSAEQKRVNQLAQQFYKIVSSARGIGISAIKGLQAGIFLGPEAVKLGLADGVLGWDTLLETISLVYGVPNGGQSNAVAKPTEETDMSLTLTALISKLESKIKAEKDPKRLLSFKAELEAAKTIKKSVEKYEESSDEGDEEDDEEEEAKGNETDRKEEDSKDDGDDSGDSKDDDSKDEDDEEDDEEEAAAAKAVLALVRKQTGKKSSASVLGALRAAFDKSAKYDATAKDVAKLKADAAKSRVTSLVSQGLKAGKLTPKAAEWLKAQPEATVKSYIEAMPKDAVVTTEETVRVPGKGLNTYEMGVSSGNVPGDFSGLSAEEAKVLEMGYASAVSAGMKITKEQFLNNWRQAQNGAGMKRY